jgi:N-acetylmuramoyl-L-alanine amidase
VRGARLALAVFALLWIGAGVRPPGLGEVREVRVYDHGRYTRVVVELSRQARYAVNTVDTPPRVYVDVEETWIEAPQRQPLAGERGSPLVRVRGGQNTLRRARVVMELDRADRAFRTFHLENPYRIVTDVFRDGTPPRTERPGGRMAFDLRPVRRIAIDPGHGGRDPGASRGKLREKDVVLRIARQLRARLRRDGYQVMLTREGDSYLSLEERTRRANLFDADLFVSVHANAARSRRSKGVETYLLDTRYDRQTARVAARENGTTVEALNDLQLILASLRLGYNERYAAPLAEHVQKGLLGRITRSYGATRDLGVKRGPFLVLFQADMPAVLVEVGFVSNPTEGKRLATERFADVAAEGIARGIHAYSGEHARRLVAGR